MQKKKQAHSARQPQQRQVSIIATGNGRIAVEARGVYGTWKNRAA